MLNCCLSRLMSLKRVGPYLLLVLLLFSSCRTTKYVPDGEYLLSKVKISSDAEDVPKSEIRSYLRQTPNPKLFDFIPFNLGLYSLSGRDTSMWINRFLQRIGDPPVIYDSAATYSSVTEVKKFMQNKGYHDAEVSAMASFKKKKAVVEYNIKANEPYLIRNFRYNIRDPRLAAIVLPDSSSSLVRRGGRFDVDVMEKERRRVSSLLRNNGYYAFDENYIRYLADSSLNSKQADVTMIVRPQASALGDDGLPHPVPHETYRIGKVRYISVGDVLDARNDSVRASLTREDFKGIDGIEYHYSKKFLRNRALRNNTYIEPGALYSQKAVDLTYSKLTSLNVLKNLNISFTEDSSARDSSRVLDCDIVLSRGKVQSFSIELEGINNEGDFGVAGKFTYRHGNIFRGGETLKLNIGGSNESIIGTRSIWNVYTNLGLTFPTFFFPFVSRDFLMNNTSSTEVYGNFNYQIRTDLQRMIVGAGMRYRWQTPRKINHQVDLIDFNYVYIPYMSEELINTIGNSLIRYSYEDHLILRAGYNISYTNGHERKNASAYTVRAGIDFGGNLLYGICAAAGAVKDSTGAYVIGGIPFSQYVRVDADFSYNLYIDQKNSLVFHAGAGVGVPYANSDILPFEKRYYAGGANSVRGWSARSLGPGSYRADNNIDYMKQSGDISLNLNVEYRTKLIWYLELAAFIDAGNIWTLRDEGTDGGQFDINEFYKQIAVGYGIGLRLNFEYFVIRLDWGLKAFDPSREPGQKWRFTNTWNIRTDTALHFAVGYPF